jgi:hypothetical protein
MGIALSSLNLKITHMTIKFTGCNIGEKNYKLGILNILYGHKDRQFVSTIPQVNEQTQINHRKFVSYKPLHTLNTSKVILNQYTKLKE